jgi:hypothetical protein
MLLLLCAVLAPATQYATALESCTSSGALHQTCLLLIMRSMHGLLVESACDNCVCIKGSFCVDLLVSGVLVIAVQMFIRSICQRYSPFQQSGLYICVIALLLVSLGCCAHEAAAIASYVVDRHSVMCMHVVCGLVNLQLCHRGKADFAAPQLCSTPQHATFDMSCFMLPLLTSKFLYRWLLSVLCDH